MTILLHKQICQATCVLAVFASIGATAAVVAGFINLGTFHGTSLKDSVAIWCGLLMFVHVFMGLMMMGTRHMYTAAIYILVNIVCLGLNVYGIFISYDYYDDFKAFREYHEKKNGGVCSLPTLTSQCVCTVNGQPKSFKDGYSVSNCLLFSFGEDLWLSILIFLCFSTLMVIMGLILGCISICWEVMSAPEKKDARRKSMRVM
ncbi:uncharacterized protein LOC130624055 [Hydractinia symbiolongicarpus]|uniref:uncharacterized protein LOC130624055 n=1 Tax=Hydractinia symbiolongicarpus TaxID=13093 RepID=UPI00254FCEBA|nr:uncharacterized protein LOC130624055 [Hydractinia symbiolongicarpus]